MILVVLKNNEEEARIIEKCIRDEAANQTDESVDVIRIQNKDAFEYFLREKALADLICIDVTVRHGIEQAEQIRRGYPNSHIILVADVDMPPVVYMKPSIMAGALLLRPLRKETVEKTIGQVFEYFLDRGEDNCFLIENREEKYRIPYSAILYFESRGKKIYACTKNMEYGFYDTMDQLQNSLPEQFVRCHRGYVVNTAYLRKIKLSRNYVLLEGDIEIPLSRSYKQVLKNIPAYSAMEDG